MAESERSARVGRPRLPGTAKYIHLRESVFNLWRERKESHGKFTDSEFAEFLLHRSHGRYDLCHLFLGKFFRLTQRASERAIGLSEYFNLETEAYLNFYFLFYFQRCQGSCGQ